MNRRQVRRGTMLARALRRRCPQCGGAEIFASWFRMRESCPTCGLDFVRGEDGYTLGALWFNLIAAEAVTMTSLLATTIATWPDVPWNILRVTAPLEAVAMPLLFFPFSRTLFLAFDLWVRPEGVGSR
ncbi:MAG TPA: DUF983 domain-containing protein [Gemmatimonadales bacterium]|nr:DUF983 domain-containing protein [Gemmatimonadales bacterium]